jgi:hypothetical protein
MKLSAAFRRFVRSTVLGKHRMLAAIRRLIGRPLMENRWGMTDTEDEEFMRQHKKVVRDHKRLLNLCRKHARHQARWL